MIETRHGRLALPTKHPSSLAIYLNLFKRCLTNWVYADAEVRLTKPKGLYNNETLNSFRELCEAKELVTSTMEDENAQVVRCSVVFPRIGRHHVGSEFHRMSGLTDHYRLLDVSLFESTGLLLFYLHGLIDTMKILRISMPTFPIALLSLLTVTGGSIGMAADAASHPNIVIVFADDLGYGDVHCYDPEHCRIPTPNIDRLAEQGLRFTDAHASAALCTPSRYSLLTGRYSWRSRLREHVTRVYGTPVIERDRLTLASLLKKHGYRTACIGKWHLGWNWPLRTKDGKVAYAPNDEFRQERDREGEPVFDQAILEGPTTRGFDEYFGVDVPNFPPYTFIENDRMLVEPTARKTKHTRIEWGPDGPMAPGWRFDHTISRLVERAQDFIARSAEYKQPFFLYLPLTTPHEPIAPSESFKGKSQISDVADLIMETDAALGSVMKALKEHGVAENTLLVFTSDNGHGGYCGIKPLQELGHRVGGPYRGYKCNISEGGHRVPMVVRWPGVVESNRRTDRLVCLSDWLATCAEILGTQLPANAGEDSVSLLPLLRGDDRPVREALVHQSYFAGVLAIRRGPWKLSLCPGDGVASHFGNEPGVPNDLTDAEAIAKGLPPMQLYNIEEDPGETQNVQAEYSKLVSELSALLQSYVDNGRSTPGPTQSNDVKVELNFPPAR